MATHDTMNTASATGNVLVPEIVDQGLEMLVRYGDVELLKAKHKYFGELIALKEFRLTLEEGQHVYLKNSEHPYVVLGTYFDRTQDRTMVRLAGTRHSKDVFEIPVFFIDVDRSKTLR